MRLRQRYEALGLEQRHYDLPHSWETNPELVAKRGRIEDTRRLMADFKDLNPYASPEQLAAERARIAKELA